MKAKLGHRIRLENRPKIQELIPLDTPLHVFVDPASACNFHCKFCFDRRLAFHDIMPMDMFVNLVNDFKRFPQKIKVIRMTGFGEPLMNRKFPDMVKYAKDSGVCETVDTTTNGSKLNPELNRKLVEAGLTAINISVPAMSSEKIREATGAKIDFETYVSNIQDLYDHREHMRMLIKMINYNSTEEDIAKFYEVFGDITDEISIENAIPLWDGMTDAGFKSVDPSLNVYLLPIIPVDVCPWIFYHAMVNANGDICNCFGDWGHKNLLGNVKTDSFYNIWNGKAMRDMRIDHLAGRRKNHPLCAKCRIIELCQPDNIDQYRKELLEKLK
jgi:radical SAM protein with 4Fe4S-binding SPASM domain